MFDQNDQSQQTQSPAAMPEPAFNTSAPVVGAESAVTPPMPAMNATPFSNDTTQPTNTPLPTDSFSSTSLDPIANEPTPTSPTTPSFAPQTVSQDPITSLSSVDATTSAAPEEDLMDIKKEALENLSPLLSQLDQNPEEKFRTTMMLIQASDNQSLIQSAYTAAKEIKDEKVRAQALLDIVNEINYFTQHKPEATVE